MQEEEVFPTITNSDASEKLEESSELGVSDPSLKEETNETNETNNTSVVAGGKRKLSDQQTDKKVPLFFPSCLYQWFSPQCIFLSLLLLLGNEYLFLKTNGTFIDLILFQEANKPPDSWFELKINTHVYVNGLPEDVTTDEVSINFCLNFPSVKFVAIVNMTTSNILQIVEVFSKCGIIKEVYFYSYIIYYPFNCIL